MMFVQHAGTPKETRRPTIGSADDVVVGEPSNVRTGFHIQQGDNSNTEIRQIVARAVKDETKKDLGALRNSKNIVGEQLKALIPSNKKKGPSEGSVFVSNLSGPQNFQHIASVDFEFNWHGNPEEVLKLGRKLGEGAYGSVFVAKYKMTEFQAAVKMVPFVSEKGREEVQREIAVLRKCRHPNIVCYFGSCVHDSVLWILMEYCEIGSLADVMETLTRTGMGKLKENQLAALLYQTVKGLAFLHKDDIKVIHRDLKSGNILLNSEGIVKIADFGISFQQTASRSKAATLVGTPLFMSPEILDGQRYSATTDIWSLGITAIEMADGKPPYVHEHPMRALYRLLSEEPPTLEDPTLWSDEINSFVGTCLAKDPTMRPAAILLLEHEFLRDMTMTESQEIVSHMIEKYLAVKGQDHVKRQKEKEEFSPLVKRKDNNNHNKEHNNNKEKDNNRKVDFRFTTLSDSTDDGTLASPLQQLRHEKEQREKAKEKEREKEQEREKEKKKPEERKTVWTFTTLSDTLDEDDEDDFRQAIVNEGGKADMPQISGVGLRKSNAAINPSLQLTKTINLTDPDLIAALKREKEQAKEEMEKEKEQKEKEKEKEKEREKDKEKELTRSSSVYMYAKFGKGAEKMLSNAKLGMTHSEGSTDLPPSLSPRDPHQQQYSAGETPDNTASTYSDGADSESATESGSDGSDIIVQDWREAFRFRAAGKGTAVEFLRMSKDVENAKEFDSGTRIFFNAMSEGVSKLESSRSGDVSEEEGSENGVSTDTNTTKKVKRRKSTDGGDGYSSEKERTRMKLKKTNSSNSSHSSKRSHGDTSPRVKSQPSKHVHAASNPSVPRMKLKKKKSSSKGQHDSRQTKLETGLKRSSSLEMDRPTSPRSSKSPRKKNIMEVEGADRYLHMSVAELIWEIDTLKTQCKKLEVALKAKDKVPRRERSDSK